MRFAHKVEQLLKGHLPDESALGQMEQNTISSLIQDEATAPEAFKQVRLSCILPPSCVGAHAAESGGDGVLPAGAPADGRAAAPPRDRTCCCCSGAGRACCGGRAERQAGPHRQGAAGV